MNPPEDPAGYIPSRGFAKLDAGIIYSTLWMESHDVVRVWIALLAMADATGRVRSSVPALAHINLVTVSRMREILAIFKAPDPDSRITEHEGRKIKEVEGGWIILNYLRYRNLMQRKPGTHAERQARWRQRHKNSDSSASRRVTRDTEAEAEAEAEADKGSRDDKGRRDENGEYNW